MVPPVATQGRGAGSGGEDGDDDKDAKYMFDRIGKKSVQRKSEK